MEIDLDELKRLAEAIHAWDKEHWFPIDGEPTSSGRFIQAASPAVILKLVAEIERLQAERDGLEGVNKILQVKHERLQARLEVTPDHPFDGIDFRDQAIAMRVERIAALEAENAELAQFVLDCGGFWGHSRSQLKGDYSLLSVIQSAFEHAERLEWFIDWYLRDGKRAEIDPQGHIRATTREIILAGIDAARATSSVPETSPPIQPEECQSPGKTGSRQEME
jgi:hypothetical protein